MITPSVANTSSWKSCQDNKTLVSSSAECSVMLAVPGKVSMGLVQVSQNWSKTATVNSDGTMPGRPVAIEDQEAQQMATLDASLGEMDSETERINGFLGIASDGWNETCESAKQQVKSIKEKGLAAIGVDRWEQEMTTFR